MKLRQQTSRKQGLEWATHILFQNQSMPADSTEENQGHEMRETLSPASTPAAAVVVTSTMVINTFQNLHAAKAVSWKECVQTIYDFFKNNPALMHFSFLFSWNSASCTYCRILCKPNEWQHYFPYPWAWDRPWQSTFFTGALLNLGLLLVLADSWQLSWPSWVGSLLSTGSEVVEGTSLEL